MSAPSSDADNDEVNEACIECGLVATSLCSGCKDAFFCSRDCQAANWPSHKDRCKEAQQQQAASAAAASSSAASAPTTAPPPASAPSWSRHALSTIKQSEASARTRDGQWSDWHVCLSSHQFCYDTALSCSEVGAAEKEAAGGGRCTKCHAAWYATRASQKKHWPFHKAVCGQPDLAKVGAYSAAQCVKYINDCVIGHRATGLTPDGAAVLYRLGHLLKTMQAEEASDVGMEIHSVARGLMAKNSERFWLEVWAVPGMPSLLLGEPLRARSTLRRQRLEAASAASPNSKLSDADASKKDKFVEQDTGAMEYCYLIINLLLGSGFTNMTISRSSAEDGVNSRPRETPFGRLAARRSMQLWLDADVRADCGDALGPVASFAVEYWRRADDGDKCAPPSVGHRGGVPGRDGALGGWGARARAHYSETDGGQGLGESRGGHGGVAGGRRRA